MQLSDLDYPLPAELIAQHPAEPRDSARLLVDRGSAAPEHRHIDALVDLLGDGDLLVVNDSRVIPARLALHRESGGAVEVLLLEALDDEHRRWECLARPARRLTRGQPLLGPDGQPFLVVG